MLVIKNLKVASLIKGQLDLFWQIQDTTEDVLDYTFTIERSEAPSGPWDTISQAFTDKYAFRDVLVQPYNRWRQYWYRIKVTNTQTDETDYSNSVTHEAQPSLEAQEMRRAFALLMEKGVGRLCWIFPVRTFGQRCPSCWDDLQQKTLVSKCETCYNTGYARGYLNPIAVYGQFDPSGEAVSHAPTIKTQQQNTAARFPFYPPLKPKDMIVESENRRWRIVRVLTTERLRAVIKQEVHVHEVPPSDIEFKVPINIDSLEELEAVPRHHFKNAQNLDGVGSEVNSILSTYKV